MLLYFCKPNNECALPRDDLVDELHDGWGVLHTTFRFLTFDYLLFWVLGQVLSPDLPAIKGTALGKYSLLLLQLS